MIRQFTIFCKLNFNKLCVKDLFLKAMMDFSFDKLPFLVLPCANCGAKKPTWNYHDSYSRSLISFEKNDVVINEIEITRIICSSCERTHAILPEIIVPHNSYSLLFILSVLKEYFLKQQTVSFLCEKYQITPSMLYRWKKLFLLHKQLWLGILENIYQDVISFLRSFPDEKTSYHLLKFFRENNFSFLQGASKIAHSGYG
jgi:hypothetical protein